MSETRSIASRLTMTAPSTATSASRFWGGVFSEGKPGVAGSIIDGQTRAETPLAPQSRCLLGFDVEVDGGADTLPEIALRHPRAGRLDRVGGCDLALVDADAVLVLKRVSDVLVGDRAEEPSF